MYKNDIFTLIILFFCFFFFAQITSASIVQFNAGMTSSGTTIFDADDDPGHDSGPSNDIIRTHDIATYRVGYSITPSDTGGMLILKMGNFSLPANYIGDPLMSIGYFLASELPVGPTGCQNIQTIPVNTVTTGVSGVSSDGQTVYCSQPSPTSGANMDFKMHISGYAPNGAIIGAPTINYQSSNNPITSSVVELHDGLVYFGLAPLQISAAPRWDLIKHYFPGVIDGRFIPQSGPLGEDGYIFTYDLRIMSYGSRKGLEMLAGDVEISDDFSDLSTGNDFPNAQLITWPLNIQGYISADLTPNFCSGWNGTGYLPHQNIYSVADWQATPTSAQKPYSVGNGGICSASNVDPTGRTVTFAIDGLDSSLTHYPTKRGSSGTVELVKPTNLDDPTNEWWIAHKWFQIWAPLTDVTINGGYEYLTNKALLTATSVTGQVNIEPNLTNNEYTERVQRTDRGGSFSKSYSQFGGINNPFNLPLAKADITTSRIEQAMPGQIVHSTMNFNNNSTEIWGAGYICDRFDNTRLTYLDTTSSSYTSGGGWLKDQGTGLVYNIPQGPVANLAGMTFEVGIAINGAIDGTWDSMNTVTNEYIHPSVSGSTQSDTLCTDADALWFSSIADLIAFGHAVQEINMVRVKYDSITAVTSGIIRVGLMVRDTYAYSGIDNAPGTSYTVGSNTLESIAPNQAMWERGGALGIQEFSDALKITQPKMYERVRTSKTSLNYTTPYSLVGVDSIVNYQITVNFTTPTADGQHTADVIVWDVFPAYLDYIEGSSTFGGNPFTDPVCANSGLPTTKFPTGSVPLGYKACYWMLEDQVAKELLVGNQNANLPLLQFDARVRATTPNALVLENTATSTSPLNVEANTTYGGAGIGFTGGSFSNWFLTVSAPLGIYLRKEVSNELVPTDTGFSYKITYAAQGEPLSQVRILDVLPYIGDGHVPQNDFNGTFQIQSLISNPVASIDGSYGEDQDLVVRYTSNASTNINLDPYSPSHTTNGLGTNSPVNTNWCTASQFGAINCPSNVSEVKAFMLFPKELNIVKQLPIGYLYSVDVFMKVSNNKNGDTYTNSFIGDSPTLTARRPGSNIVTTKVLNPDIQIDKSVSATIHEPGDTFTYSITVTNKTGDDVGPVYAEPIPTITVSDTLPPGIRFSDLENIISTSWDCSDSSAPSTIICQYTGSLPVVSGQQLGSSIDIIVNIDIEATIGSIMNTASVELVGQEEQSTTNNSDSASIGLVVASIGDKVWFDSNHDGIQDPSEEGMTGMIVTLYDDSGNIAKDIFGNITEPVITNDNGEYIFENLHSGNYIVGFTTPNGFTFTFKNNAIGGNSDSDAGLDGNTNIIVLEMGESLSNVDAGIIGTQASVQMIKKINGEDVNEAPGLETNFGDILNFTFEVTNTGNTMLNEIMIMDDQIGVVSCPKNVILPQEVIECTATYAIPSGVLTHVNTAKVTALPPALPNGEQPEKVEDTDSANAFVKVYTLSGYVYTDLMSNLVRDGSDYGMAGIEIRLSNGDVVITNEYGYYEFTNLVPGNYTIVEMHPEGYISRETPTNEQLLQIIDTNITEINFGESYLAPISGRVFVDGTNEPIVGVVVTLYNESGNKLEAVTTDESGRYIFLDIPPGNYTIVQTQPNKYENGQVVPENIRKISQSFLGLVDQDFSEIKTLAKTGKGNSLFKLLKF